MTKLCLNLGCGSTDWRESTAENHWINIDRSKEVKTDFCFDFAENGLGRWNDDSIAQIHCGCSLEQLSREKFLYVVNECHRVLKFDGRLEGYVPSIDPRVLHLDIMDVLFFQVDSFKYFDKDDVRYSRFFRSYGFKPWYNICT